MVRDQYRGPYMSCVRSCRCWLNGQTKGSIQGYHDMIPTATRANVLPYEKWPRADSAPVIDSGHIVGQMIRCTNNGRFSWTSLATASDMWQVYWITSFAWKRSNGGIVRPRALAVFRLMTNSNFMGCSTGRSSGLAPLRILST